jgi:V8-like Glu-specific endopeptidase
VTSQRGAFGKKAPPTDGEDMTIGEWNDKARSVIDRLTREHADNSGGEAKTLIKDLRDNRQFKPLIDVATAYQANAAFDADIVTWQAQGLIETGNLEKARELLIDVAAKVQAGPQFVEAKGILGRAWKQSFFESADKSSSQAREAIGKSLAEYKACSDAKPGGSVWADLNRLALTVFANRNNIPTANGIEPRDMALKLLSALDATPINERDNFYHASRAEAYLGLEDLEAVEIHIGAYVRSEATPAFNLASTLRQFTELWQLDRQGPQGHGIIQALQASLLHEKQYGRLELSPDQMHQALGAERPSDQQLQKILGAGGLARYDWLMKGLTTARSVGVISHAAQGRQGTGFLVRGGALIPNFGDELIVVTNAHVISEPAGDYGSVAFGDCTITFEAVDKNMAYEFDKVLWQSAVPDLDCTLLRLKTQPDGIKPLEIATNLPPIPKTADAAKPRVYVIGYPGGRELTFSLQDNDLLDHEAPPDGAPPKPNVCRVQYRAPTEHGSSGSPVFESSLWRVIALHHAGDDAMERLNGKGGTWPANEGIWIQSIVKAAGAANP